MRDLIKDFPNQLRHALETSKNMRITEPQNDVFNIVIAGLGGSGIGANLVQSVIQDEINLPITIVKTYDLPAFVNYQTLVICCSFSGNTEETLSVYHQAKDKDAKVIVIASGGKLVQLAEENKDDLALLPNKIQSPRANIGYSVVQLLHVLEAYKFISNSFKIELENTIALLEQHQPQIEQQAKELAKEYYQKLPIFYSDDRFSPVIVRNQQQINENSKQLCHINVFPEFNHNELVGWVFPEELYKNSVVTIFKSDFDHARVNKRMEICHKVFVDKAHKVIEINAKGASFIEQAYYVIHLFDFVSVDLAELNKIDAGPVAIIDYLKGSLAKF